MYRRIVAIATAVTLLVTATALAAGARPGQYKGRNAQGQPISFTIAGKNVTGLRYKVRPTCKALGQTLPDSGDAPEVTVRTFALKGSSLSVHQVEQDAKNSATTTTDVVATVAGGAVSGYTQDKVTAVTQGVTVTCSTPKVRFTAKHV